MVLPWLMGALSGPLACELEAFTNKPSWALLCTLSSVVMTALSQASTLLC